MITLGIESSCDETAVALVRDGTHILASRVQSQVRSHQRFGGVVPEIAAREHVRALPAVLESACTEAGVPLSSVDLVAVTDRPGLQSALLAGIAAAEALSIALDRPVVGVNHIEAHLVAPFLAKGECPLYPFVSLVVSGGHTHLFHSLGPEDHLLLGATIDDAAGEAFDKVAKVLGLPYPGGPEVDRASASGRRDALAFARPMLGPDSLDFSFSGLKTSVLHLAFERDENGHPTDRLKPHLSVPDIAASFQAAVVDVLVAKLGRAVEQTGATRVSVGGGVACNRALRAALSEAAAARGLELWLAPPALCADNAAMVAARGHELFLAKNGRVPRPAVSPRAVWRRTEPVPVDRVARHG